MIREREKPWRELALAADEDLAHGRAKIVVHEAMRHRAEVRERADVTVEKARLVLARIEPREIALRVHEAHHEHVRFAPLAADVDEHLEEVDLGEVAGLVHQRHEHLFAPPLPLANDVFDGRIADDDSLAAQHRVQARSGQPLFAGRPMLRVLEQRFDARPHRIDHGRARHATWLTDARRCAAQVTLDRVFRNAHLACETTYRHALHQVSVTNDVDLFHDEHPPSERRESGGGGGSVLARRKGQFCDGGISARRKRFVIHAGSRLATNFGRSSSLGGSTMRSATRGMNAS
ncbi:MAG TPA: hypothetical protein VHZ95_07055 [Polyangiales bacterium]|nr:hypothetical protein [Polyangiales bacterium]